MPPGTDDTHDQSEHPGDGGDVARDPDAIQREIEQTRAELADSIDAIADRLSPKRAASRGAQAVKAQVSSVFDRNGSTEPPASVLDADPAVAAGDGVAQVAEQQQGTQYTGTTQFAISRSLRADRVLLVLGAGAAVAALVVVRRSRR